MRIETEFGVSGWIDVALACFYSLNVFVFPNPGFMDKAVFVLLVALVIVQILRKYLVYWDIAPEALRERSFWRHRITPWDNVLRIVDHGPAAWLGGKSGTVEVVFLGPAPESAKKRLFVRTAYRNKFVEAVREHAPHAAFEDGAVARNAVPGAVNPPS